MVPRLAPEMRLLTSLTLAFVCLAAVKGQLFDFKDGNFKDVEVCEDEEGVWEVQPASNFPSPPNGDLSGFVLSSSENLTSCITSTIMLDSVSYFNILVYIPYSIRGHFLTVFLCNEDESDCMQIIYLEGSKGWWDVSEEIPEFNYEKVKVCIKVLVSHPLCFLSQIQLHVKKIQHTLQRSLNPYSTEIHARLFTK